jgi:N,N'-diacetyllegionaminate synthase
MQKTVNIGGVSIGLGHPVFIIAEAGVNHNGDIELAKRLVYEAKRVGADCVKFQTFKAERIITRDAPKANYQLQTTDPQESQFEMLRKLELSSEAYRDLIALCKEEDIVFLSTPYNIEDVDFLDELGVLAFKTASIHIAESYFLQYVARKGKPMIVSTGMAMLAEVDEAVRAIRETGNERFVMLQCTTNYPSRLEDANLRAMQTMRDAFDVLVGYSDHTQGDTACLVAVALGACVIEKHFTLDRSLPGPDQSSSADPAEFEQLATNIRQAEMVLGSSKKEPCEIERVNAGGMRRSIVARHRIPAGQIITQEMLTFKRPASGLRPALFSNIVGRVAVRDIEANQMLSWEMCGSKRGHRDI